MQALRHLFNRMLGHLHHCLQTRSPSASPPRFRLRRFRTGSDCSREIESLLFGAQTRLTQWIRVAPAPAVVISSSMLKMGGPVPMPSARSASGKMTRCSSAGRSGRVAPINGRSPRLSRTSWPMAPATSGVGGLFGPRRTTNPSTRGGARSTRPPTCSRTSRAKITVLGLMMGQPCAGGSLPSGAFPKKPAHDPNREVVIDVGSVRSERDLHGVLKRDLGFPSFYGMNWDAFWDAVTGLVEMPKRLRFVRWAELELRVPLAATMLRDQLKRYDETVQGFSVAYEQ